MRGLAEHLARDVEVRSGVRVTGVERDGGGWRLRDDQGVSLGRFDVVVMAVPAPQAVPLLEVAPDLQAVARGAEMAPCWAVLVELPEGPSPAFDAAFVQTGPLSWVASDASRPGRAPGRRWVLHASSEWSAAHVDDAPEEVAQVLVAAFGDLIGGPIEPTFIRSHRWLYALPREPLPTPSLFDPELGIGACGDWCGGPRIEGAYLSGAALAGRILGSGIEGESVPAAGQASLFDALPGRASEVGVTELREASAAPSAAPRPTDPEASGP
jgi:predicted NAD/FAD-dependent oxidoreductase